MALSADRNTPKKDGQALAAPVAANAVIFAGALLVANATGYAAPGSTAATLTALGRATQAKNNTGGADGAIAVEYERGKAFKFKNSAGDAVTQASLGKEVFIEDDETVSGTNAGGNTQSVAGICLGVEADGVWVFIG